jgi:uncharacterized protein YceK
MAGITGTTSTPSYEVTSVGGCCSKSGVTVTNSSMSNQTVTYYRCNSSGVTLINQTIPAGTSATLFGTVIMNTLILPVGVTISNQGNCSSCNP